MRAHDGMLYAVTPHLRDVWVAGVHQGLHPRTDRCDEFPHCRPIGTLADYLGVGTGVLEVKDVKHWRDSDPLLVLRWYEVEPREIPR